MHNYTHIKPKILSPNQPAISKRSTLFVGVKAFIQFLGMWYVSFSFVAFFGYFFLVLIWFLFVGVFFSSRLFNEEGHGMECLGRLLLRLRSCYGVRYGGKINPLGELVINF